MKTVNDEIKRLRELLAKPTNPNLPPEMAAVTKSACVTFDLRHEDQTQIHMMFLDGSSLCIHLLNNGTWTYT